MAELLDEMEEKKLPSTLNVLTILTFIGSGLGLIFIVMGYFGADKNYTQTQALLNDPEKMNALPAFIKNTMTSDALERMRLMAENKLPIMLLNLVAVVLCFVGALQMRKQKKSGYYLWLIGEILPFIATIVFINAATIYTGIPALIGLVIVLVFILLYAMQLKNLK